MKKIIGIVLTCLLLLNGSLYTIIYSRSFSIGLLEDQVSQRSEKIYTMLTRERDGPLPFEEISTDWSEICMSRIEKASELIRTWYSHIDERVMQYGK